MKISMSYSGKVGHPTLAKLDVLYVQSRTSYIYKSRTSYFPRVGRPTLDKLDVLLWTYRTNIITSSFRGEYNVVIRVQIGPELFEKFWEFRLFKQEIREI